MDSFAHVLRGPGKSKLSFSLITLPLLTVVLCGCAEVKSAGTGGSPPPSALAISTTALPTAGVQSSYTAMVSVSGGVAPYHWSISSGSLPIGLSLGASTGQIAGTPAQAGTASFTVQVTDSSSTVQAASQALSITVSAAPTSLSIISSSLSNGVEGTAYSITLAASGGTTPYSWSISAGSLPTGLSLAASTGAISGTPTTAGTFGFTVQVTDSTTPKSLTALQALSITVTTAGTPLSVAISSLAGATQGTAYSATLAASGGTTPYSWSISSGSLPAGLSLTSSTGAISGTPTTSGTFSFTVQVTDSSTPTAQTATKSLSITVSVTPVGISTSSLANATQGTAYSATLAGTGGTAPYTWSVSAGSLPTGLTLAASTGVISGTPTASGAFSFTVQLKDSTTPTAQTASKVLSITVASSVTPVSVTTSSLTNGTQGTAYSATLAASGGTTPYSWSISSGSLPAGLSLTSSTGAISGTPTTSGTFSFTVQVTDSSTPTAQTATKSLSITVSVTPVGISTSSLANATQGTAYSATLAGTGGTAPYTWSVSAGSLPTGLTLAASTGVISGTPTASGAFSFTVQLKDSTTPTAQTASKVLSITVASSVTPVSVTTSSLTNGTQGTAYSATLAASGGTTPYSWSISSGSLPAGLSLTSSTGAISGTPTTSGTFSFTVQVTDSTTPTAQTATKALSITVAAASTPLTITTASLPNGSVGTAYSGTLAATGGTAPYIWSITSGSLPAGLSLNGSTISGTPTTAGTSSFTVQAKDSTGQTAIQALSITVSSSGPPTGTALNACQTISAAGIYYLAQNVSSTGDCFPIATSGSVTINLNGFSITYATSYNSDYARYGISEISCSDPDLSNGTANGASCSNVSYSGTLTVFGPGSINNTTGSGQSSHGIRVGTINGVTSLVVHDATFNLFQPSAVTDGAGEPIYTDYESVTAYNNIFKDSGSEIARCLGQTSINRQYFCGAVIQAQDSAGVTAYNNIWNKAGTQNSIRSGGAANIHDNLSGSIYATWWNDFYYEVEGSNSTVTNNVVDCEASKGGNCRGIQIYNSSGSSVTNNMVTAQEQAVSRNNVGDSPGCQIGGAYGIQINGNPGYPSNTTISGNTVTVLGDECGANGFSSSDHGSGVTLSNNVWNAKRVGSSTTCSVGGGGQFIAAMRLDDKQYGATGTLTSIGDTLIGDCGSVMVWWDGATSWTCKSCTFTEGSNPDTANYHTFNFFNGGNATDPFYIIDPTFTGGAAKDSNNLSSAYLAASYLIQWTYILTVQQSANGSPVTSATITVKDALNNTECSGAVNSSGVFSCVVTEERWYNSGGAHQENHNPQSITISATGCTTDTHSLTVTSPASEIRTLTGTCN